MHYDFNHYFYINHIKMNLNPTKIAEDINNLNLNTEDRRELFKLLLLTTKIVEERENVNTERDVAKVSGI